MPSLKEQIENNLAIYFLGVLFAGFLAGMATYDGTLRIAGRTTIATDALLSLEKNLGEAREEVLQGEKEMSDEVSRLKEQILQNQQWLDIRYVNFASDLGPVAPGTRYRLVIFVDDVPYSYPPGSAWWEVGKSTQAPKLPLPPSYGERNVRAEIFLYSRPDPSGGSDENLPRHYGSQTVKVSQLSVDSRVKISGHHWQGFAGVDIAFEIRSP